jgi:hypothetical protein
MSEWSNYYKSRVGDSYSKYCKSQYEPFLKEIGLFNSVSEEGCGIATISKLIHREGKKHTAFDLCKDQLGLARLNVQDKNIELLQGNILTFQYKEKPETIVSHGVLEHFSDADIRWIIHRQRYVARKVVHYVPLIGWGKPSFGDERLLSIEDWRSLVRPTRTVLFNDNKDAVLVWEDF